MEIDFMGDVGTLLWELRTANGLSLEKLALKASVSKSTLSHWETGRRVPRVVELESVMDALGATAAQRSMIFAQIDAPRAVRRLREQNGSGLSAPPIMGELIRALRLRKGCTQAQIARQLGVSDATVTRWERGERNPGTEQVQMLCYVLAAQEEEIVALTTGKFSLPILDESAPWAEAEPVLWDYLAATKFSVSSGLEDLRYFALQYHAWKWAMREPAAWLLLADAYVYHAQYSRNLERWTETRTYAQKAAALLPKIHPNPGILLRTAILTTATAVYGGQRRAPKRGISLLQKWREQSTLPQYTAWILGDMAEYAALAGQWEAGLYWAAEAHLLAKQKATNPVEGYLRAYDYGRLLIRAGKPADALQVLPEPVGVSGTDAARVMLALSEAYAQAGNKTEAHTWLMKAQPLIQSQNSKLLQVQAEMLIPLL